jgi:hypothetical protein
MFPESMIFPSTMASCTSSGLAKGRRAMAGTAMTTRGFTLWAEQLRAGGRNGQPGRGSTGMAEE